jgi:SHS2 domain-containing protein
MATVEMIDHTADVGIAVRGDNPADAFVTAATAMFDIMVPNRSAVEARHTWDIIVDAADYEDLLVTWLEELLYHYEIGRRVPADIDIADISATHLAASVRGEPLDQSRHETSVQIKAVTYHQLQAAQTTRGFEIRVIFDI